MKKLFGLIISTVFCLMLVSCGTSVGYYADANKYLVGNQNYNKNITSLVINWVSGDITLIEDESIEGVKIEETTDLVKDEELVHSYLDNGELKIQFFASGYQRFGFSSFKKKLVITYNPGLENFKLDLTSGSCNAATLTSSMCDINITSGSVKIDNLIANNTLFKCTSGDIEVTNANVKEFNSDMTSGSFTVGFANIKNASFDMTSGSINMTMPKDGGTVTVFKTSGKVYTNRECSISDNIYSFGSGEALIEVDMTSGKVRIS